MESARAHVRKMMEQGGVQTPLNQDALAIHQALASGNSIAFIRGIAGKEGQILSEVATYIQSGLDMNHDGRPDLTETEVNMLVKKVLDLHVRVGLLNKQIIRGEEYYVMPPTLYNPTTFDVLMNSFFSNQWPFLTKDTQAPARQPAAQRKLRLPRNRHQQQSRIKRVVIFLLNRNEVSNGNLLFSQVRLRIQHLSCRY